MRSPFRALAVLVAFAPAILGAASLYVAPTGDDSGPGTEDRPVRTLHRAQELARAEPRPLAEDLTIWLAGGLYRLDAPLVLTGADSGAAGHPVEWKARPGETPVISGAVRITGWAEIDPARHVWAAPAPAGLTDTRQLYIDGVRAGRTRGRPPAALTAGESGYLAASDAMAAWRNAADLEFVYLGGGKVWGDSAPRLAAGTEARIPVRAIHGRNIVLAQPAWTGAIRQTAGEGGGAGLQPDYVENAYELLGPPGQWYFDRAARIFYYVPRPGEDPAQADVEAAVREALLVGAGTSGQPLHDLGFEGLQFSCATWLPSADPESRGLRDPRTADPGAIPGGVALTASRHVQFLRDVFVHLGGAGLWLGGGAQDDAVIGCVFTDISGSGLELDGAGLPEASPAELVRGVRIADNHFQDVAAEFHGGAAIVASGLAGSRIAHNQIDHVPGSGIVIGRDSRDNRIADNLIFDHLRLLAGGAGIRIQGRLGPDLAEADEIAGNVVRDPFGPGPAIFLDGGASPLRIERNLLFHSDCDDLGGRRDGPVLVAGNFWQQGDPDRAGNGVTVERNRIISDPTQARALAAAAGIEPEFSAILETGFAGTAAPAAPERVAAIPESGSALVAWDPPRFEGGEPIRSYTVMASGGQRATISAGQFDYQGYTWIGGLPNGAASTFTVTASSADGASPPSAPSSPVTPENRKLSLPAPPRRVVVFASGGMASVHIYRPESDGGGPILSYEISIEPGERKVVCTGPAVLAQNRVHAVVCVIDGLAVGRGYTFAVAARNAAGAGKPAAAVATVVAP